MEFTTSAIFNPGTTGEINLIALEGVDVIGNSTKEIVDNRAEWKLKGKEGNYLLEYEFNKQKYSHELVITNERAYAQPVRVIKDSQLNTLNINNAKVKPISWLPFGWLGTYIIFSIIFSMGLRKILKLH